MTLHFCYTRPVPTKPWNMVTLSAFCFICKNSLLFHMTSRVPHKNITCSGNLKTYVLLRPLYKAFLLLLENILDTVCIRAFI